MYILKVPFNPISTIFDWASTQTWTLFLCFRNTGAERKEGGTIRTEEQILSKFKPNQGLIHNAQNIT